MSFSGSTDADYLVRVAVVSLFNHLDPTLNEDVAYAYEQFNDLLILSASKQFNTVQKRNVFPNTALHRQKCRLLQGALVLFKVLLTAREFDSRRKDGSTSKSVEMDMVGMCELLWLNVKQEALPSTRAFFEWMLAMGYARGLFPTDDLLKRVKEYHGGAAISISVLTVAYLTANNTGSTTTFKHLLLSACTPYFIHNNHAVRMYIIFIWERLCHGDATDTITQQDRSLAEYIRKSEHTQKFIAKLKNEHFLGDFDIFGDLNIEFVFGDFVKRIGLAVDECIPYPSFMRIDQDDGVLPICVSRVVNDYTIDDDVNIVKDDPGKGTLHGKQATQAQRFQQKMVPVELAEETIQGLKRLELANAKLKQMDLVIMASFVDKVPNLAGLARTCEVLGASKLVLPDINLIQSDDFQAVCMTADKWLPMEECKPDDVLGYVEEARADGFRIVAIEQSSQSVLLNEYRFHTKTLLILGNEREGVPASVLHLVDDCVEIPQVGMVRSLNVHVTGSIVLWEAKKQLSSM